MPFVCDVSCHVICYEASKDGTYYEDVSTALMKLRQNPSSPVVATSACHPSAASQPTMYERNLLCERGANSETQSELVMSVMEDTL